MEEDAGKINAIFHIESQGNVESIVKKALEKVVEDIKKEEGIEVKEVDFGDVVKSEFCSLTAEINVYFRDLRVFLLSAAKFGPSAIEVFEPEEIEIDARDFLKIIGEIIVLTKKLKQKYGFYIAYPERKKKPEIGVDEDKAEELVEQGYIRAKVVVERNEKSENKAAKNFLNEIEHLAKINKYKTTTAEGKSLVAAEIFVELLNLVNIILVHTPVLVEIVEPKKLKLKTLDIQDIALEIAGFYFDVAHVIRMKKAEA